MWTHFRFTNRPEIRPFEVYLQTKKSLFGRWNTVILWKVNLYSAQILIHIQFICVNARQLLPTPFASHIHIFMRIGRSHSGSFLQFVLIHDQKGLCSLMLLWSLARVMVDDELPFVYCRWSQNFFHCELSLSLNASSLPVSIWLVVGEVEVVEMTLCWLPCE